MILELLRILYTEQENIDQPSKPAIYHLGLYLYSASYECSNRCSRIDSAKTQSNIMISNPLRNAHKYHKADSQMKKSFLVRMLYL